MLKPVTCNIKPGSITHRSKFTKAREPQRLNKERAIINLEKTIGGMRNCWEGVGSEVILNLLHGNFLPLITNAKQHSFGSVIIFPWMCEKRRL